MTRTRPTDLRFWSKVQPQPDGCWEWQGATTTGYGRFHIAHGHPLMLAHRYSYTTLVGPVPDGLDLDHLCRNRRCVRPDHLEPVTHRENLLRSPLTWAARRSAQTHCVHGHEFTPENTFRQHHGTRGCRTCRNRKARAA